MKILRAIFVSIASSGGCESARTAVTAFVYPVPVVTAGPDEILCINDKSLYLADFTPAMGTWSGAGISADGLFNPAEAGLGSHTLLYTVTQNGCSASATKKITITAAPVVTLAPFINIVCVTNPAYILTGGWPAWGTYSGRSVSNGKFNASASGVGTDSIFYTYAQSGGCAVTVAQLIRVSADCPPANDLEANLGVAPNPALPTFISVCRCRLKPI